MEWEKAPVAPPPRAWLGLGINWGTQAQTHGGVPGGAGLDFSWLAHGKVVSHTLRLTHRTWRAPTQSTEHRLAGHGVKEGVQSYWSGRMVVSSLTKFVRPHKQESHFGMQGGWLLQRTQHVGPKTQKYLIREHNLYWGPLSAVHFGAQLHAGLYRGEEELHMTGFFKALDPIAARLNPRGEGMVINGKMRDPIETVAPELEAGLSLGRRLDPYLVSLDVGTRIFGPSRMVMGSPEASWRTLFVADVALSKAF
jgi:hypothetical protein